MTEADLIFDIAHDYEFRVVMGLNNYTDEQWHKMAQRAVMMLRPYLNIDRSPYTAHEKTDRRTENHSGAHDAQQQRLRRHCRKCNMEILHGGIHKCAIDEMMEDNQISDAAAAFQRLPIDLQIALNYGKPMTAHSYENLAKIWKGNKYQHWVVSYYESCDDYRIYERGDYKNPVQICKSFEEAIEAYWELNRKFT